MKPTLQLRLGQSLAMTPQLQQAIRLLQLSTLELQQEIQQALDANPLLEQEESDNLEPMSEQERDDAQAADEARDEQDGSQLNTSEALNQENMPDELPMDTTWDELYTAGTHQASHGDKEGNSHQAEGGDALDHQAADIGQCLTLHHQAEHAGQANGVCDGETQEDHDEEADKKDNDCQCLDCHISSPPLQKCS